MAQNKWFTLRASSAMDESEVSDDQVNRDHKGVQLVIDNTAETGTDPTVTVKIEGKSAQGDYFTILESAALGAQDVTTLTVYPGIAATANVAASANLPRIWRATYTLDGTPDGEIDPSVTFSVSANLLV